ncbi:helix-turn-helix domain-containing protein [Streptomyces himalayensis]|uniref:Helix-turn-helix transcriptional regulator n=1 Tax=Streptomyces himalayensis subsp. himalayensis TaxID=2756131 RepID=A0A7W0DVF2_9ACTN|nr:helix-turn-helix transcriptional regulator [Streptomyces himalayensis]MBA2951972.1 helix-turn-helix transcriptional regulator [Streptomyces himalayensis subsp. himalayensis]
MPPHDQPPWILDARRALGARIAARRMYQNLTQERLAEAVGIDRSTLQRIEGGYSDAKISHLLLIAHALDIRLAELLEE